ncbi:MAG: peptidoglycan-associated lipoprotein Pal [Kofleriaceae bacterium]|nr:peptidoglycan-associated lipoprotein Pal [Kofleriaceae bacterium]
MALALSFAIGCGGKSKKPHGPAIDEPSRAGTSTSQTTATPGGATVTSNDGDDLSWLAPVYFAFDSSDLVPQTRDTLARLHDWLSAHPKATITIEGHCDEQGTTEYNIGLGQRRAQAMTDYLVRLGTNSNRVSPVSYGAERPVADGHDEVAWSKNRRGEFSVRK